MSALVLAPLERVRVDGAGALGALRKRDDGPIAAGSLDGVDELAPVFAVGDVKRGNGARRGAASMIGPAAFAPEVESDPAPELLPFVGGWRSGVRVVGALFAPPLVGVLVAPLGRV